ncbi:MAG TPA: branched-chain amino acid transaminase [Longimicrobiales bacterium]|nr:branched-chain amino acid transaminase [Longimicrobiales bacterium]
MSSKLVEAEWIWKDGELVPWRDATVHLLSLAVQFGSSVFEGIRCYATPEGPAVFRLDDHLRRLRDSCRIYRIELGWSDEELKRASLELIAKNGLEECYLRPMVLRGYGAAGLNPTDSPVETYLAAWPWGTYLGEGALERGVDVCVSTWLRAYPNTFPVSAKAAGHYNSAQLIKMEAMANGYAEGIALGPGGLVSEGSGQNLFLVRDGALITPILDGTSLRGITRDTILVLAREAGLEVREEPVPRESLYTADELFFTGTAAEVTPIRSVDRIPVGEGRAGPVTLRLQRAYMDAVKGTAPDTRGWRSPVRTARVSA